MFDIGWSDGWLSAKHLHHIDENGWKNIKGWLITYWTQKFKDKATGYANGFFEGIRSFLAT